MGKSAQRREETTDKNGGWVINTETGKDKAGIVVYVIVVLKWFDLFRFN